MAGLPAGLTKIIAIMGCLVASSQVTAQVVQLKAELRGTNEVPPVQSLGRGNLAATYDPATRHLSWIINYSGLSELPVAMHFHGPADPARNAGIAVPITGNFTSPIKGFATLSESHAAMLLAGQFYLNIHTIANPAGELRGQVTVDSNSADSSGPKDQSSAATRDQDQAAAEKAAQQAAAKAAEQEAAAARAAAEKAAREAAASKAAAEKAEAERIARESAANPTVPKEPASQAPRLSQRGPIALDAKGCQAAVDALIGKENISFQSGSAVLSASSGATLEKLKSVLLTCGIAGIEVSGHTDSIGSERSNRTLSQQRAQAIVDFLSKGGVPSEKLVAVGYGSSKPIASNNSAEGRARNRRIELAIK
jgi:outer membrane protein OmpA-like peptidoglycan-associated protein